MHASLDTLTAIGSELFAGQLIQVTGGVFFDLPFDFWWYPVYRILV